MPARNSQITLKVSIGLEQDASQAPADGSHTLAGLAQSEWDFEHACYEVAGQAAKLAKHNFDSTQRFSTSRCTIRHD